MNYSWLIFIVDMNHGWHIHSFWGLPNPPAAGPSLDLFGAEVKRDYLCTNSDCCLQWNQQKCCLHRNGEAVVTVITKISWTNRSVSFSPWAHHPPKDFSASRLPFVDSKNRNSERLSVSTNNIWFQRTKIMQHSSTIIIPLKTFRSFNI